MQTTKMLLAVFVILTITLAAFSTFEYLQSNTLRTSGSEACQTVSQLSNFWISFSNNATNILNQQIQNDNSLISVLNSTKPAGYVNMTNTLNTQIQQDTSMIQTMSTEFVSVPPANYVSPCATFNQP
jgi:hypothetical protein